MMETLGTQIYSVTQLIRMASEKLQELGTMWIEGEIISFKRNRSNHWYVDLKGDSAQAQLNCCIFYNLNRKLDWTPKIGDKVQVLGHLNIYRGGFSFIVRKISLAGKGTAEQQLQELRRKLQEEGLFAEERKRKLPRFPQKIGIATSATSQALKDILAVLQQRMPGLTVYLSDCTTEGEEAASSIIQAIERLEQQSDIEVIIVGRGGGSTASLKAFDQEPLIRKIANCSIPIVCAVGHEGDHSLSDLVADYRAATPTHAAEAVTAETQATILLALRQRKILLDRRIQQRIQQQRDILAQIRPHSPKEKLQKQKTRLSDLQRRLEQKIQRIVEIKQQQIIHQLAQIHALNPASVLERGYAVATKDGQSITDAKQLNNGDELVIRLANGQVTVRVFGQPSKGVPMQLTLFD